MAAESSAPPIDTLTPESLGIKFTEEFQLNRFNRLKLREIKSTKWVCPYILNQLGICADFDLLCNNVGFYNFVFQDVATYRHLTLEFFSTLTHTVDPYGCSEEQRPGLIELNSAL